MPPAACRDLRADACVGEELEQQRVRPAPVDDVGRLHPAVDRVDAGLELRPHSALDAVERGPDLVGRRLRDARFGIAGIPQPAIDVGEEDGLVSRHRRGDLPRGLVGVHVV
jgi:hypothetical protein